ncbi:2Fe-2S iron-sulfur cluster-binding protein [Ancylobacter radicis]|uniref:2Fe-2S iron-sulfur cluster binding domain-containing protein n=1 Tax=Ancylobacter radicis TaxID=2836179 RepID=A0ABS5R816_9HYPH|nr:adenylate/guanylate cyclase domain-containing protein [Ancylobacter radicis]MBS9477031.1 2Fe-2S iron-sulfur cluster binding domain-containing protein [Ancylobacter radicis]
MSLTSTSPSRHTAVEARGDLRDLPWACMARLWSGIILFAFVLTHLLNHAVGIFGVGAMEYAQHWRWLLWQSWPGTVLLYGAALTHMVLASYRIALRRTWRMPKDEAWQIVSGLAIPLLVAGHVLNTRVASSWFDADISYHAILYNLFPAALFSQSMLLVVSWSHGVIGMHHALRYMHWYRNVRVGGLVLAVLIPVLALAGFVAGGREAIHRPAPAARTPEQIAGLDRASTLVYSGVAGFALGFVGLIGVFYIRRRVVHTVTVTYRGYGPVEVPCGTSLLEASRMYHIPHPSTCRGRGRCSTCRVQILSGAETLPQPFGAERAVLASIGAPGSVRLACQIRPEHDLSVRVLMPVLGRQLGGDQDAEAREWAIERDATVLVLDLRAFSTLTHNRLPYEIAVLVNRFSSEMTQAVESHGGRIDQMYGDGLMAVFDASDKRAGGARAALRAARDMTRVLELLNSEMRGALPIPVRAGIGIHTGSIVLARVGDGVSDNLIRAIGNTVAVAVALEAASKEFVADYVVSTETAEASGFDFSHLTKREMTLDSNGMSVSAYAIPDVTTLDAIMAGKLRLGMLNPAHS